MVKDIYYSPNYRGNRIRNIGAPVDNTDAATKLYVDNSAAATLLAAETYANSVASGYIDKLSVLALASSNVTLSGAQTIDGISVVAGNRVAVVGQTDATTNGIYVVNAGAWTRASDLSQQSQLLPGVRFSVSEGTVYADSLWILISDGPLTLGTSDLTFSQYGAMENIQAGNGLSRTGNVISAVGVSGEIIVSPAGIGIATGYTNAINSSLTSLGSRVTTLEGQVTVINSDLATLDTRIDNIDPIITDHGTRISSLETRMTSAEGRLTTAETNITTNTSDITAINNRVRRSVFAIGNGVDSTFTITHTLASTDFVWSIFDIGTGEDPEVLMTRVSPTQVEVGFQGIVPSNNQFKLVMIVA
jgi:hypothetical protein